MSVRSAYVCLIQKALKVSRMRILVFFMFSSFISPAVSEYRLGAPLFANTDASFLLAQADEVVDSSPPDAKPEVEVLQEFANEADAAHYINSLEPYLQSRVEIVPFKKEMLRTYLGPFATQELAQQAAAKIDTSIVQYRIGLVESLGGYIISFGMFQNDENLQNFYRVLASFGFAEINNIPLSQEVYRVVKIPEREVVAEPGVVEGLSFDSLFFNEVPATIEEEAVETEEEQEPKGWFSSLDWSGYLKNETAYRYHEPRTISKIRNTLYLSTQYSANDYIDIFFAGWYYYDLVYDWFNYDTVTARSERDSAEPLVFVERLDEEKDSNVADIRELYADVFLEGMDLRIGKQYIIWGVLEGVRVVDEINPMDFRELILPDLLDYRIPLWSLKLDYFGEDTDYEFVWIPDLRFHKPAPRGSEWEMLQDVCIGQAEEILCVNNKPNSWTIRDSEVGFRVSKVLWDTEMTFSYFYTWDDFPVLFRAVRVDTTQIPPAFFPTYTRIQMYGATAVKQVDKYILKGELAYVTGKYFGIKNTADADNNGYVDFDGVLQREHVRWGLGVEFNFLGFDLSPGMTQWIIFEHEKAMMQDKFDTSFNLFVRKELPEQSAVFQMLLLYLKSLDEVMIKPKFTVQLDDRLQLGIGLDLFYGQKSDFGSNRAAQSTSGTFDPGFARAQFVGNFHNNDRIFFELKYSF